MAERFKDEGFTEDKGKITIDSIGTGGGFERFCKAGETDIANASRTIKDEEAANCDAIDRTPVEFRVGTDALAVVVSRRTTSSTTSPLQSWPRLSPAKSPNGAKSAPSGPLKTSCASALAPTPAPSTTSSRPSWTKPTKDADKAKPHPLRRQHPVLRR